MANESERYTAFAESGKNDGEMDVWCYAEELSDI